MFKITDYGFWLIKDTLICGSRKIACIFNIFVDFETDVVIEREKKALIFQLRCNLYNAKQ